MAKRINCHANLYPIGGFKDDLVYQGQGQDVYHHILFTAGDAQLGDLGFSVNGTFLEQDKDQVRGGRLESKAEVRDDYAGMAVGEAMLKTTETGKNGDYARLYDDIKKILCQ